MIQMQVMSFNPTLESTISPKGLQAHSPMLEIFILPNKKDMQKEQGKGETLVMRKGKNRGREGEK